MNLTTIQIKIDTRDELKKYGRKDETYDEIIKKLMKAASVKKFYEDMERILESEEFVPLGSI